MNSQEVVLQKGYWYSSMDASLKKVLGLSVLPTGLYGRFRKSDMVSVSHKMFAPGHQLSLNYVPNGRIQP